MYEQFFIIFALVIMGFFLGRRGIMDENTDAGINKLIMKFIVPCMFIYKIGSLEMTGETMREFFFTLAVFTACLFAGGLYAYLYSRIRKFPRENSNVAEFCMVLPNNAFMGFPVASTFFGEFGLLMMAATNAAMNIYMFSYGVILMDRNGGEGGGSKGEADAPAAGRQDAAGHSFKEAALRIVKHLMNPMMASLVIALVICGSGIKLPGALNELLGQISGLCTPLAMLYVGSTLSRGKLLEVLKSSVVIESGLNKIIVMPLMTWALVYFLPLSPIAKAMCVLAAAMPTAAMTSMLAGDYKQDVKLAGMILLVTTALSAATMLGFIQLINMYIM